MDFEGTLKLLIVAAAVLYAGLVAFVVLVARALVPEGWKRIRSAIALSLIVAAIVGPTIYLVVPRHLQERENRAVALRNQQECSKAAVSVRRVASSREYFVDLRYLDLLFGQRNRSLKFEDLLQFMMAGPYEALEFPARDNFMPYRTGQGKPFVRLQWERMPSGRCGDFQQWLREHPGPRYPSLRRQGMPAGVCLATEYLDAPRSRYRVSVDARPLPVPYPQDRREEFDVKLVDSASAEGPMASLVEIFAYSGGGGKAGDFIGMPCDKAVPNQRVEDFKRALGSPGSDLLRVPQAVELPAVDAAPASMPDRRLRRYRWTERPDTVSSAKPVAADGTVWVEHRYGVRRGASGSEYALMVLAGRELLELPIAWGDSTTRVTGLGVADGRVAVVVPGWGGANQEEAYLVEFDLGARRAIVSRLSAAQIAELIAADSPARK